MTLKITKRKSQDFQGCKDDDPHVESNIYSKVAVSSFSILPAAGGTSCVMPMVDSIGVGLTFMVFVLVQVVAIIEPFVQWKYA